MITYDDIEKFVNSNGCTLIDGESGSTAKITVKCSCGREYRTTFARFKYYNKRKCDVCSGKHYDKKYVSEYLEKCGSELLSDNYINDRQILNIRCSCGNVFQSTFLKVKSKNKVKCNKCSIGRENPHFLNINEVNKILSKAQLKLLSEYKNSSSKLKLKCRCGNEFYRSLNKVSMGQFVCPECSFKKSKVEILATEFLEKKNINFETEYTFHDLRTRKNVYLRFDFAIFDDKSNLICLIELDGSQHYEAVKKWGGEDGLKRRKYLDSLKNDYCKSHNIRLYRVPYWNFNRINEELENILNMEILCQVS